MSLNLIKHTINEVPPEHRKLLMCIKVKFETCEKLVWTCGFWNGQTGWSCEWTDPNFIEFNVIEWYKLPTSNFSLKNNYSKYQKNMEDFWYNK